MTAETPSLVEFDTCEWTDSAVPQWAVIMRRHYTDGRTDELALVGLTAPFVDEQAAHAAAETAADLFRGKSVVAGEPVPVVTLVCPDEWLAPGVLKPAQTFRFPEMTAWRQQQIARGAEVETREHIGYVGMPTNDGRTISTMTWNRLPVPVLRPRTELPHGLVYDLMSDVVGRCIAVRILPSPQGQAIIASIRWTVDPPDDRVLSFSIAPTWRVAFTNETVAMNGDLASLYLSTDRPTLQRRSDE